VRYICMLASMRGWKDGPECMHCCSNTAGEGSNSTQQVAGENLIEIEAVSSLLNLSCQPVLLLLSSDGAFTCIWLLCFLL